MLTDSVGHPPVESSQIAVVLESSPEASVPKATISPSALVQVQYAPFQPSPYESYMVSVYGGSGHWASSERSVVEAGVGWRWVARG